MRRWLACVGWLVLYAVAVLGVVYLAQIWGVRSFIPFRLEGV